MATYRETTQAGRQLTAREYPDLGAATRKLQSTVDLMLNLGYTVDVHAPTSATVRINNLVINLTATH